MSTVRFREGDYIKVTTKKDVGPHKLDTVLYGTALNTMHFTGWAVFQVRVQVGNSTQDITLNHNDVETELIFSADHARSMTPGKEREQGDI